jgi:hypothetical protein
MQITLAAPRWCPTSCRRTETSSYRTWLKRIAAISWLFYAIGILLIPLWDEARERNRAFERASASYQVCKNVATERGIPERQIECDNVYRARMDRDDETYRFGSDYRSMGWHAAWVVPAALFAPPLVFFVVVYGLILGLVKTVNWLGKGFREEAIPRRGAVL